LLMPLVICAVLFVVTVARGRDARPYFTR